MELASAGELDSKVDLFDVRQKPKFFAPKLGEAVWEPSVPGKVHIFNTPRVFTGKSHSTPLGPVKVQYIPISEASYLVDQVFPWFCTLW